MATFKGNPVTLIGEKVKVGDKAPNFSAINTDLSTVSLENFKGKRKLISVIPSIDTGVCEFQTRKFNEEASKFENTVVITVSCDLPFALRRWCGSSGLDVITLSDHKDNAFGKAYGVLIEELRLLSRATFIIDENDTVVYAEYVEESSSHPDYEKALNILK